MKILSVVIMSWDPIVIDEQIRNQYVTFWEEGVIAFDGFEI